MDNTQKFRDLLKSRSLKATSNRLKLLEYLQSYETAMPYSQIQKSMKPMDRVTLYRTLNTLLGQGIIHQAFRDNNETYYALCGHRCSEHAHHHEHIHFSCNVCKEVTCQEIHQKIEIDLPNFEIDKVSIVVKGTCQKCTEKS